MATGVPRAAGPWLWAGWPGSSGSCLHSFPTHPAAFPGCRGGRDCVWVLSGGQGYGAMAEEFAPSTSGPQGRSWSHTLPAELFIAPEHVAI